MKTTSVEKYFFFALLAIAIIATIIIFYPFITVLILASALAVVLNPFNKWIKKNITMGKSWASSLITVIFFTILICGPLFFLGTVIFNQTQNTYTYINNVSNTNTVIESIGNSINKNLPDGFAIDIHSKINELVSFLSNHLTSFFTSTLQTIVMFLLMLLTIFYLLKDGSHWKHNFIHLSPLSESSSNEIFLKLSGTINKIIKGSFLIAISQGILISIGFLIFGVPNPVLWGVTAGMASFVPTIGTSLISIPAIAFLFFTGLHAQALGLLIWSIILVGLIDNMLAPYVIGRNTEIPSLFILFSILGGVTILGPAGILIGPLVLSFLYSLISIYRKETGI